MGKKTKLAEGKTIELTDEQLAELLSVDDEDEDEDKKVDTKEEKDTDDDEDDEKDTVTEADADEDDSDDEDDDSESEDEDEDDKKEVSEEEDSDDEDDDEDEDEDDSEVEEGKDMSKNFGDKKAPPFKKEKDKKEVSEEEDEDEEEDSDDEDKKDKKDKKEVDIKEDMNALFNGENLSEEFMEKASTIFSAAISSHLTEEVSRLEVKYTSELKESVKLVSEQLTDKIDTYLDYVVEEWVKENELAIEQGLRLEIMETFMNDLKTLFINNNIEVPADKVDLVAEANSKFDNKEAELNEEINRNVELNRQLSDLKRTTVIKATCSGLTDTQAEKLSGLSEGVEFVDVESYEHKLRLIRENYFPEETNIGSEVDETSGDVLVEDTKEIDKVQTSPLMESYVSAISRTIKK